MFEIVTTSLGVKSIRNTVVNEIMHNPVGPWAEANQLYIDQSKLRERLLDLTAGELVVFDVGLGAAANALAVLHCAREIVPRRNIKLISFEKDLELLRFALKNAVEFAHFSGFEVAIQTLLDTKTWTEPGVVWELREGDFTETVVVESEKPHLVFFDPYSPEVNREMWGLATFKKLRALARQPVEGGTILYTYSRATPIRVALMAAGFFVGVGQATGLKDETTQASTVLKDLSEPLGRRWLERWRRSHTPYPLDLAEADQYNFRLTILGSSQF